VCSSDLAYYLGMVQPMTIGEGREN